MPQHPGFFTRFLVSRLPPGHCCTRASIEGATATTAAKQFNRGISIELRCDTLRACHCLLTHLCYKTRVISDKEAAWHR